MNKETYEALRRIIATYPYNDNGENDDLWQVVKWLDEVAKEYQE